jgi:hypothetical protein
MGVQLAERTFTSILSIKSNSEVLNGNSNEVLKLTLAPTCYTWECVPDASFPDSGNDVCF